MSLLGSCSLFLRIFDIMVVIIRKGSTSEQIARALNRLRRKKGFNALKYAGILELKEDPLKIQKALRDEWH